MADLALVPVQAFYRNADGKIVPLLLQNRLMAADLAPAWEAWRREAMETKGWELLLTPASDGGEYTRSMFRTPADQQFVADQGWATAGLVDNSVHQAGRAVDLNLVTMQAIYPNYSYAELVAMARRHGFINRVFQINGTEPWHFDDNPATIFGSVKAAVEAVGNTLAQVAAAVAAGLDSPQMAAVRAAAGAINPIYLAGGLVLGLGVWKIIKGKG